MTRSDSLLRRRDLLHALGGMPLVAMVNPGCQGPDAEEEDMSSSRGLPPWHMWGVDVPVNIALTTPNITVPTSQLAKVHYKHPTTWRFLFFCNVNRVTTVGATDPVIVFFDLIVGVGRSTVTIASFATLQAVFANNSNGFMWTSATVPFDATTPGGTAISPPIDTVVAEDIQCSARVLFNGNVGDTLSCVVGAYFAPEVHVRPDWFAKIGDFGGNEREGR
jgi:hypothetical protein